jgi:hypothetical protein
MDAKLDLPPVPGEPRPGPGLWQRLEDLVADQPASPAWHRTAERFASIAEYLQVVTAQLEDYLANQAHVQSAWRTGLSLDLAQDLERTALPALVTQLRSFAADGSPDTLFQAVSVLLELLIRNLLRDGVLPVYLPLRRKHE